jgi:LuxR family maltose regulon positive regulatory protein
MYQQDGRQVTLPVGTPSWFAWLQTANSFTFKHDAGSFTARKTRASNGRGSWYWYAYRRRHGRLFNLYLGASERVTLPRLLEAARALTLRVDGTPTEQSLPSLLSPSLSDGVVVDHSSLLTTKLCLPRLPVQHVPRPRLLTLLEQGVQRPVTLVSAAAGSGKTTLMAEWASKTVWPVAWLSLEATEDDPSRFLSYLQATLASLDERIGTTIRADRSRYSHDHEWVLTSLLNDLTRFLQQDVAVILDDYHLITSDEVHAILHFLLDHLPPPLHLIIGTRVDPPLPLARLRARNQISELGTQELRFASSEVDAFVHTMGLTLSAEATALLEERTEGWIAGIQLLTLALRGQSDVSTYLRTCRCTHHFLVDYVGEEILARQTPELQRFLLQTCLLERLCGPLCDALTGEHDGQARLAELRRANLFVSELDDTQTWYRYHSLFAESLRAWLHKQEPELIPELYRRASYWYEQQQWREEACEYAFRAGDQSRAMALLADLVPHLIAQGKFTCLGQWLSRLSPASIASSAPLWLASIWIQCHTANTEQIIELLEQQIQEHAQDTEASWADLQEELTLYQAWAALSQDDLSRTISLVHETLRARPNPESALSRLIAVRQRIVLSAAYRASGDLEAAEQVLLETARLGSTSVDHPLNLFATMNLAELYENKGQLRKLGHLYDEILQMLDQRGDPSPLFLALTQARYAALLYEWNRLDESEAAAQQFMDLTQRLDLPIPNFSLLCLWILARGALAVGNSQRARQLLEREEFDFTMCQRLKSMTLLQSTIPAPVIPPRLALACGLLEQAERWEKVRGIRFDDPLLPRLSSYEYLDYLTLARILLVRGRSQRSVSSLAQASLLLDHLCHAIVDMGCNGWLIELQMLTALVLQAQGKTKRALQMLGQILEQAEAEGYVRLFADEGQPMAHLLAQVAPFTSASSHYLQRLQAAIPPTLDTLPDRPHAAQHQPLIDPLSMREQEVLHLLSAGYSNQQIAQQLVISLHTVKLHVKHILAKLTVTNRTQAVARARELQVLLL